MQEFLNVVGVGILVVIVLVRLFAEGWHRDLFGRRPGDKPRLKD